MYQEQMSDVINKQIARKPSTEQLLQWLGLKFYISSLAVKNIKSKSTPIRKFYNSSQISHRVSLNSALAKGPNSYLNSLLGVLLRWREEPVVILDDIRKMYNSIYIEQVEQHCHRIIWRDLEDRLPDVYVILRVTMGDCPAAAISTEAIYKLAALSEREYPAVAQILQNSAYVNDVVHSVSDRNFAVPLANKTAILRKVGFQIKYWRFSDDGSPRVDLYSETTPELTETVVIDKVLGVLWNPVTDHIYNGKSGRDIPG